MPRRNSKAEIIFVLTIVWFLLKSYMHVMLLKSWRFSLQQLKMLPSIFVVTCFLHFLWWLNTILRTIKKGELIIWCCRVFLMSSKRLSPVMKKEKFSLQMLEDYWISNMKSFIKREDILQRDDVIRQNEQNLLQKDKENARLIELLKKNKLIFKYSMRESGGMLFPTVIKKIIKTKNKCIKK